MELPVKLRQAVDLALQGQSLADLQKAADRLSLRYRAETRDGRLHLDARAAALAYIAARLPATYAAIRDALTRCVEIIPDFAPQTLLDIGSGPGTALWASEDCFSSLTRADLLDASGPIRELGESLSRTSDIAEIKWSAHDVTRDKLAKDQKADLVTLSYVLDELAPERRSALIAEAWAATQGVFLIVEPGTPAGYQRILQARDELLALEAHILAPCTHSSTCPLVAPDWCHFARRVARSSLHRQTKRADVPWEDEKYIYLVAARDAVAGGAVRPSARVLAPPRNGSGKTSIKLCSADGSAAMDLVTRRDGDLFKQARRAEWGDLLGEGS